MRAGVHTGECERRGEDLAGIAVHIGARIGARADPCEVLVSSTVRELVLEKMKDLKMTYEYVEVPGGGHIDVAFKNLPKIFAFFDQHLRGN